MILAHAIVVDASSLHLPLIRCADGVQTALAVVINARRNCFPFVGPTLSEVKTFAVVERTSRRRLKLRVGARQVRCAYAIRELRRWGNFVLVETTSPDVLTRSCARHILPASDAVT